MFIKSIVHRKIRISLLTEDLEDWIVDSSDLWAVDCEFMGLNLFRDGLCTVQLYDSRKHCYVLYLSDAVNPTRLITLIESQKKCKIFHAMRIDTARILRRCGARACNVHCTKIASKISRTYSKNHSLQSLARELLGESMDKSYVSRCWAHLGTVKQEDSLKYCALDTVFLPRIYCILRSFIRLLNRDREYLAAIRATLEWSFLETRGFNLAEIVLFSEEIQTLKSNA